MVEIGLEVLKGIGAFCALIVFVSYLAKSVYNARNNDYVGGLNGYKNKIHSLGVILMSLAFVVGLVLSYSIGMGSRFIVTIIVLFQIVYALYEKDKLKNIIPNNEIAQILVLVLSPFIVGFLLGNTANDAVIAIGELDYKASFMAIAFIIIAFMVNVLFVGTYNSHTFSVKRSLYFVLKNNFELSILNDGLYKKESIVGTLISEDDYSYYIKTEKNLIRIDKSNVAAVIKS